MDNHTNSNPLKNYFRHIKTYMKLPSGTSYYAPGAILFTDSGEVGILPMTGQDELTLKNPDALLNGEALISVIKSCVPAISNPRILLTNDIDAIITAIRYVTFNDKLETEIKCPKCGHEHSFKLNLQSSLDRMSFLEKEYVINLNNWLSVFVKPYGFSEVIKGLHAQFEQSKVAKLVSNDTLPEEEKMKILSNAFKTLSVITYDLINSCIVKIVDEANNVNVTDKSHIREFLINIEKENIDKISDLVKEINNIGIARSFTAVCEKCNHEWSSEIDFNPVNFS